MTINCQSMKPIGKGKVAKVNAVYVGRNNLKKYVYEKLSKKSFSIEYVALVKGHNEESSDTKF